MSRERNPWAEARVLLKNASPKVRRVIRINVIAAAGGLALAVTDVLDGTDEFEIYRILGIALAMVALVLMSQVYVLHALSQQEDPDCVKVSYFNLQSTRLHGVFRGVAFLGVVSALLFAVAIGLFIPSFVHRPVVAGVAGILAVYMYLAIRTVRHITDFLYDHAREQAEAAAKARAAVTEAQLKALQAQMQPHFLFNALNTVAALVRTDPRQAERTVENLAQVLRRGLERARKGQGTVKEEIEFVEAWLAVEQQRWGNRLAVSWDVDPAALDLSLPPMTLQPLVENALKHGLSHRIAGGHIDVRAARENGALHLTVSDDGEGISPRATDGTGLGNLRQRLWTRYGDNASVRLSRENGRTVAEVRLPAAKDT